MPRQSGRVDPVDKGLRGLIRAVLTESFDDVLTIELRVRIKISKPTDPSVLDVLTDIRGLCNVITALQVGTLIPAPEGRNWIHLKVRFIDNDDYSLSDLVRDLGEVRGVDMVRVRESDTEDKVVTP